MSNAIAPRINILGTPLVQAPVGNGPATGFFRNSFCDASPMDRASHTVAAVITPEFLKFSASRGNDLSSLFPTSGPSAPISDPNKSPCVWCLCSVRWAEALTASRTLGEQIVPRVYVDSTHFDAMKRGNVTKEEFERFAVVKDDDNCKNDQGEGMSGSDRVAR